MTVVRTPTPSSPPRPNAGDLGQFVRQLIAFELGKPTEAITLQFVVTDRAERFYPDAKYTIGSAYGGYRSDYLPVLSLRQFDALDDEIEKTLAEL